MGLKHIDYSLASWKKSICSVCEIFTSKDVSYVPIWKFGDFPTVVDVANYLKTLGDDYYNDFVDMMIFDALIYNTDRHHGNFGLLIDSRTNKLISLAPIFDNGLACSHMPWIMTWKTFRLMPKQELLPLMYPLTLSLKSIFQTDRKPN